MPTQQVERLCPELFDYIIDFLHDDEATLRSCSLVCHSWVPTSRIHLFHQLDLIGCPWKETNCGWAPNTACRRIYGTLGSSPYLAGYVNKLSVGEESTYQPSNYRWVSSEIVFPPLLKKLKSLKEIQFNFPAPRTSDPKTVWSTMVFKDISDALATLTLQSFTLRQFSFSNLSDFIKLLERSWRHLESLQLDAVDIFSPNHFSSSTLNHAIELHIPLPKYGHQEKANLRHLLLRSNNSSLVIPILLHARSPFDLRTLTSLVINITSDNYGNILELLTATPNLEHLEMEIETIFDYEAHLDDKGTVNLNSLPVLRDLSLQITLLLGRIEPMTWMIPFFSTATSDNVLAYLSVTCIVDKPPPTVTVQTLDNSLADWRAFDDLLSCQTFSALKRFRLDFALDNPIGDTTPEQLTNEYIKQLPNLSAKGVLEVDICEIR